MVTLRNPCNIATNATFVIFKLFAFFCKRYPQNPWGKSGLTSSIECRKRFSINRNRFKKWVGLRGLRMTNPYTFIRVLWALYVYNFFLKYADLFVCCSLDHNQSHKSTYILPLKYANCKIAWSPTSTFPTKSIPILMGILKKYNRTLL